MIKHVSLLSLTAAILLVVSAPARSQKDPSADVILQKVANKLASVKVLGYKYRFEFNYPSQGRSVEESAQGYLDLDPADGTGAFKYQFSNDSRLSVYNGSESFIADKKSKKIWVENNPSFRSDGLIILMNSPLTLKYALPKLIADKAIQKKLSVTKVDGRDYYLIEFSLPKAAINTIGEIFELRVVQTSIYRLTIDKRTFLPVEVLRANDKNDEFIKVSFADVTEKPAKPNALSWYFSTYQNEYKLQKKVELSLIHPGQTAPDFKLGGFGSDSQFSLEQHKGKAVLLEFWIAHCGFCIAAVPKLNAISDKFRDKGLELVSINIHDPAEAIEFFKKNNRSAFMILTGGESVSTAYGIDSYPAIVLIGKNGKVVYSSLGLREDELERAILANLQ